LLAEYLVENSIYTLSPNHNQPADQDPVAPYLFGDMRGYCVHFAHAMTFMLRSLGIPARIGTGYLTDLSQAKDGHILLRMSDRHAWAEVFVTGFGWIPFDVQPKNVESHADSQIDMKLLEELMGILEPGEEILPSESSTGERGVTEEWRFPTPSPSTLLLIVVAPLILLSLLKLFLITRWSVQSSPELALRLGLRAVLAILAEMGIRREFGETRQEFAERVRQELAAQLLAAQPQLTSLTYSTQAVLNLEEIKTLITKDLEELKAINGWRYRLYQISPLTLPTLIRSESW
jgi:hypothetical protein